MTRQSGFTLIEFLLVMVLLSLLAAVGSNMLSDGFMVSRQLDAESAGNAEARYLLDRLARELRAVKRLERGDYCFDSMEPGQVVFWRRPIAGTGLLPSPAVADQADCTLGTERVSVQASGSELTIAYRQEAPAFLSRRLAPLTGCDGGSGFCIRYLAADGISVRTLATRNGVAWVELSLRLSNDGGLALPPVALRVALRNQ